jgi:hypothetical protein
MHPELKEAVRRFYREICQYCGNHGARHVEHIVSRKRGGEDCLSNTTLACDRCNIRKGTLDLDPMFLSIAHARAKKYAPLISAISGRYEGWVDNTIRDVSPPVCISVGPYSGGTALNRRPHPRRPANATVT